MRRALFYRIVARIALFVLVTYLILPLPEWITDFEYIKSLEISNFLYNTLNFNQGNELEMQDFILIVILITTSSIIALVIMAVIELSIVALTKMLRAKKKV